MWGLQTLIDLRECDQRKIRSEDSIKRYLKQIVELIDMTAHGEPIVIHFGSKSNVAGYTMLQLIETSLISGHFIEATNSACIDIFSCKSYDSKTAAIFTAQYFVAKEWTYNDQERLKNATNT